MTGISRQVWADAYARQARSDWDVYRALAGNREIPPCHPLHYLQMACEKIAKAYRWRDTFAGEHGLTHEHVAFSKFIQSFLGSPAVRKDYQGRVEQLRNLSKLCRKLAREVEKLAPAVDRVNNPENAEYPWEQGSEVVVPCDYGYPSLSLLGETGGRTFLNFVSRAFSDYDLLHIS
jgi:hypothetical protein